MKIEETCNAAIAPVTTAFASIALGTVFQYYGSDVNIWLRVNGGIVNLMNNSYKPQLGHEQYKDFTPFPAARVVLK